MGLKRQNNAYARGYKMVRQTSIRAYIGIEELGEKQKMVFEYIRTFPGVSDREISDGLKMRINSITGRRNELVSLGMIEEAGEKRDALTNRNVLIWRIKS